MKVQIKMATQTSSATANPISASVIVSARNWSTKPAKPSSPPQPLYCQIKLKGFGKEYVGTEAQKGPTP